jgi:rhamnosyltransferase
VTAQPAQSQRVSVVIVAKDEEANLRRSLPRLGAQQPRPPDEVLVIDSGSSDGTREYVAALAADWPALRLHEIAPGEFHHARTRNLGAAMTSGAFLVYLGGDAIPSDERWLSCLLEPLLRDSSGHITASYGRQAPTDAADLPNRVRMLHNYPGTPSLRDRDSATSPRERYSFSSVSCCIRREALAGEPPFDESLPVNEDMTLSQRLIDGGFAIAYRPDSVVLHSHNYTVREVFQRYFDNGATYRQLGIFGRGERSVAGNGAGLLRVAKRELQGAGPVAYARFAAFYVAAGVGLTLGIHHDWLPKRLARRMSKYGTV